MFVVFAALSAGVFRGSVSALSNSPRMLYSGAGDYPRKQALLYAESFSPNIWRASTLRLAKPRLGRTPVQ